MKQNWKNSKKPKYCNNKQFLKIYFDDEFYMIRDEKTGYFNASKLVEKFSDSDAESITAHLGDSLKILEKMEIKSCYTINCEEEHSGIYVCHALLLQMANWINPLIFTKCYYLTVCKVKKPDRISKKIRNFFKILFFGTSHLLFL